MHSGRGVSATAVWLHPTHEILLVTTAGLHFNVTQPREVRVKLKTD